MFFRRQITETQIPEVLARTFALTDVASVQTVSGGTNRCYRFRAGGRELFLKQTPARYYRKSNLDEPHLVEFLRRRGIPAPRFLASPAGKYVVRHSGQVFCLQEFVPGRTYAFHTAPRWLLDDMAGLLGRIQKEMASYRPLPPRFKDDWLTPRSVLRSANVLRDLLKAARRFPDADIGKRICEDLEYRASQIPSLAALSIDPGCLTHRNSHGDYVVSQLICSEHAVEAVIDFSGASTIPSAWEMVRSYVMADPACEDGSIAVENLVRYVGRFMEHAPLSAYDLEMMPHVLRTYFVRWHHRFRKFLTDRPAGDRAALDLPFWVTRVARWLEVHAADLSRQLIALAG